jgi:predicted DNA-binding protein (UPF0251 family)
MAFMVSIFEEPSEEAKKKVERIRNLMSDLPPREADFLELYFFGKLKQTEIAAIFRVSQPTVHYRIQRAAMRIKYMLELPDLTEEEILSELEKHLTDPVDVKILVGIWKSTCQSEVAKSLGESQGLVRHRFLKSIVTLWSALAKERGSLPYQKRSMEDKEAYAAIVQLNAQEPPTKLSLTVELFESIRHNLNKMREVLRPSSDTLVCFID